MMADEEKKVDIDVKSNEDDATNIDLSNVDKTLYCIRHAQSLYNETIRNPKTWLNTDFWLNWFDPKIHDPLLSQTGKQQTNDMANKLDKCSFVSSFGIELIVTSPLQRAIHTMSNILQNQMETINSNNISIIAHHQLREWVDTLGDIGTSKTELMEKYNTDDDKTNIDFSCIDDEFWWNQSIKTNDNEEKEAVIKESKQSVNDRISAFKHWILQREENNILVVGHSRWFREFVGAMFKLKNCQMMKVQLHGMKIQSWEYIDFDEMKENKNNIDSNAKQSNETTLK